MKLTSGSKLNDQIWSAYNPGDQVKAIKSTDMRYAGILKENREDWSETKLVRENFAKGQEEIYEQQYAFGKKDPNESYIIEDELVSLLPQYQPKRVVKEQFLNGNFGMRQGGKAILNENLNEGIQDMDDYDEEHYGDSIDPEDGLSTRDQINDELEEIKDAIENARQQLADRGISGEPNYDEAIRILMTGEFFKTGKAKDLDDDAYEAAKEALASLTLHGNPPYNHPDIDFEDYIEDLGQHLAWIIDKGKSVNEAFKSSKPDVEEEIIDAIESTKESLLEKGVYGEPNYDAAIHILMTGKFFKTGEAEDLDDDAYEAAKEALDSLQMSSGTSPYDSRQEDFDFEHYVKDLGETLAWIIDSNKSVNEASKDSKPDYIDLDKDGNNEEPMEKAAEDAKKTKKLNESYDPMKLYFDQDYRFKA
jgi:hypothetical protein